MEFLRSLSNVGELKAAIKDIQKIMTEVGGQIDQFEKEYF